MTESQNEQAFEAVSEEARLAAISRMMEADAKLMPAQRTDIAERCLAFLEEHDIKQAQVAREIGISTTRISEVLRLRYVGRACDSQLVKVHNWLELAARRAGIVAGRKFVRTAVAKDILVVARTVAETCKMGVVYGPAQIGKSFTLRAIEGDQAFGCPVLIRVDEPILRPFPLMRAVCRKFELSTKGTFDRVWDRLVKRLAGTKRLLMFDEAERLHYKALEAIRDLHDETGCPVLFVGKPAIYEKLGFRALGDFSEVTDQLAGRIVVRRDLTERARGHDPQPLFTLEDIKVLVRQSGLKLHVDQEAHRWLQRRASTLGLGGLGKALVSLYLAARVAFSKGDGAVTVRHLEAVDSLAMGHEDAETVRESVAQASGMRRVV